MPATQGSLNGLPIQNNSAITPGRLTARRFTPSDILDLRGRPR